MSKNVFRLSEAQHDAYRAKRAAEYARRDGMNTVLIGGIAKPILVTVEPASRASKYGNVKTDGYDSKKEASRAFVLRLMQEAGEISGLVEQARFPIRINGVLICTYVCDFGYTLTLTGERVVEDVKSVATAARADYRIKKRLMRAVYSVEIKET